jgi:NAD(P)-dependent dehydrogenase (short-subunit alcohol dehydrogenase family)
VRRYVPADAATTSAASATTAATFMMRRCRFHFGKGLGERKKSAVASSAAILPPFAVFLARFASHAPGKNKNKHGRDAANFNMAAPTATSTAAEVVAWLGGPLAAAGRTALVTGASSGLGQEVAAVLAVSGATVVAGVLPALVDDALAALRARVPGATFVPLPLDLASLASVRAAAAAYVASGRPLHVLVNNAGVMACPCAASADGYETHFAVNYLGHHALTAALLPVLRANAPARVVAVSSAAHALLSVPGLGVDPAVPWETLAARPPDRATYDPWAAYGGSKLALAVWVAELQRRSDAGGWGLVAAAVHPGAILTTGLKRYVSIGTAVQLLTYPRLRAFMWATRSQLTKSVAQGAATIVYAALAPSVVPGGYHADCAPVAQGDPFLAAAVHMPDAGARLWALSESIVVCTA